MGSFTYYVNTLDKVRDAGVKMLGYKCCGYKCIQSCNYSVIRRQKVVLVLTAGIGRGF